jgi:divalent metal cation (Fe/Co/Zn/Cd) transporter
MATTPTPLPTLPLAAARGEDRAALIRQAKLLAWIGVGWHGIEAAVAIGAGVLASSVALVGFGADSLVEAVAGVIVLWRFAATRAGSEHAERRAQQLIAVSFFVIALYVGVEAFRSLIGGHEPEASWIGIGLSLVTLATMPALAVAKGRVGDKLGSSATKSEGRQNMLCAYLSGALLVGLLANAALGWWWADPVTALVIAAVAVREGRAAWHGDACCTAPAIPSAEDGCTDACCAEH